MNTLTRRTFGKRILAAGALPLLKNPLLEPQSSNPEQIVTDTIAGYKLTKEEKQLVAKFLSTHEKNMAPLREKDLPNSLAPSFVFGCPTTKGESGEDAK